MQSSSPEVSSSHLISDKRKFDCRNRT